MNKLYIYSNQEWGQNKGQMPQGLNDVEKLAKGLDICLEWKLASFFESEFVIVKNDIISKHFFTFEKSLFSTLEEMQKHSENLLKHINTHISFNELKILLRIMRLSRFGKMSYSLQFYFQIIQEYFLKFLRMSYCQTSVDY
ncbi:hypothetical protein [Clostridium akagii]|uniref:hypothetical protein n=1 Tax=Clostridium akagii TaxID=91623 RepID=UPI00047925DE|nr:hypothetical protein [Clostridium akagii]